MHADAQMPLSLKHASKRLGRRTVAAATDEAVSVAGGRGVHCRAHRLYERLAGAGRSPARRRPLSLAKALSMGLRCGE